MSAQEAKEYGLVDEVFSFPKISPNEHHPDGKDGKEITQCVFCAKGKKEGLR
jgi:hypothetical protein